MLHDNVRRSTQAQKAVTKMQQWFEESSYDVITSCVENENGTWHPVAVFSEVHFRGHHKRPLSTCQWDRQFDSEEQAHDAAMRWARSTAREGLVPPSAPVPL